MPSLSPIPPAQARQIGRLLIRGCFTAVMDGIHDRASERILAGAPPPPGPVEIEDYPDLVATLGDDGAFKAPLPDDLFAGIVGLKDEQEILLQCVTSADPFHALLIGPPGSGKSELLRALRQVDGARYMIPQQLSVKGLRDVLLDRPRLVLIEEVGTGDGAFQGALLTAMDGIVTKDIAGEHEEITDLDTRFIGTCNSVDGISAPLLERFWEIHVNEFDLDDRRSVMRSMLETEKGLSPADAATLADLIAPLGVVRDARQIGEVWRTNPATARKMVERLKDRPGNRARTATKPTRKRARRPAA